MGVGAACSRSSPAHSGRAQLQSGVHYLHWTTIAAVYVNRMARWISVLLHNKLSPNLATSIHYLSWFLRVRNRGIAQLERSGSGSLTRLQLSVSQCFTHLEAYLDMLQARDSQVRAVLLPQGYLAMSVEISGCHNRGQRPGMLLNNILQFANSLPHRRILCPPNVNTADVEKCCQGGFLCAGPHTKLGSFVDYSNVALNNTQKEPMLSQKSRDREHCSSFSVVGGTKYSNLPFNLERKCQHFSDHWTPQKLH